MQRNLQSIASLVGSVLTATVISGCTWNVNVDGGGHRGPRDGRDLMNGGPHDVGLDVISVDGGAYGFQSKSVITPRGGPFRLHVRSADPAPSPPVAKNVFPDFVTHYQPSDAMDPVTVNFDSPPLVDFMSGWMYFKGKAPIGKTRRVRAIGSGTEMLIEIAADADYIYVLGEATSQVFVSAVQPDGTEVACTTLNVGQYLAVRDEIDDAGAVIKRVCSTPASYMDDGARQTFVRDALAKVAEQAWK